MSRLDRFTTNPPRGKYALVKLRKVEEIANSENGHGKEVRAALQLLRDLEILDFGDTDQSEFFVIRLRDKSAYKALCAYSDHAKNVGDSELGHDVFRLACKSLNNQYQHSPT